jgi:mono/diheme cytochrome c family protein
MGGGSRSALAAEQIPPAAMQEAQQIFNSRCTMCHGAAGKGDGPAAAALKPQPRDLGDPAWQKSVTDEHIEQIIVGGGVAVGKSPLMPANADLRTKPDVVKALRALVRNLGRPS